MKKFKYFAESWWFLENHPELLKTASNIKNALDIDVVKVNPETGKIHKNPLLNTETEVWLEFGFPEIDKNLGLIPVHDVNLDCGAPTFEEAIVKLANLVYKFYGGAGNKRYPEQK